MSAPDDARSRTEPGLGGHRRVLFVHAHPDDETLSTGIALATVARSGGVAGVLTATRGERGEVVPGPLSPLEGTPELAPHREAELRAALAALGVAWHAWLGSPPARAAGAAPRRYADSGMRWGEDGFATAATAATADSFTSADPAEALSDVLAALEAFAPDAVVSYDERGGYGHPDHVRAQELARRAAAIAGVPFLAAAPPDGADERPGDLVLDGRPVAAEVRRALAAHASQLTLDGPDLVLSGGQRRPIALREAYRLRPAPAAS